jgi:hypothetical protein
MSFDFFVFLGLGLGLDLVFFLGVFVFGFGVWVEIQTQTQNPSLFWVKRLIIDLLHFIFVVFNCNYFIHNFRFKKKDNNEV